MSKEKQYWFDPEKAVKFFDKIGSWYDPEPVVLNLVLQFQKFHPRPWPYEAFMEWLRKNNKLDSDNKLWFPQGIEIVR